MGRSQLCTFMFFCRWTIINWCLCVFYHSVCAATLKQFYSVFSRLLAHWIFHIHIHTRAHICCYFAYVCTANVSYEHWQFLFIGMINLTFSIKINEWKSQFDRKYEMFGMISCGTLPWILKSIQQFTKLNSF